MSRTTAVMERAIPAVLAGWFVASVLAQHPDRSYDKVRRLDKSGTGLVIPNWRFFAPNPAVEDQHFLYRLANEDKTEHTEWREVYRISPRKLSHAFWFPGRRIEKAIFDVAATLLHNRGGNTKFDKDSRDSSHQLIVDFVRTRLTPEPGYPLLQVMLVRYSGYDHSENPKYDMLFEYEKVSP